MKGIEKWQQGNERIFRHPHIHKVYNATESSSSEKTKKISSSSLFAHINNYIHSSQRETPML